MKIKNLDKPKLITEGWNDPAMTLMEEKIIIPFVKELEQYVIEANLSQDQIKQLFTGIEQGATAAGGNRTAIGKGVDVAKLPVEAVKWIDNKINELGKLVQNAGPVKNADAKFEELKQKIGSKDSKVVQAVKGVSDWAKKNPGKASIAVGILTAAAAVAGGPLGGAVAGFIARATKDLLQGQKLSTAVGKSIKTAAYGALAGAAIKGITDNIIDNIAIGSEAEADAMMDAFQKANFTDAMDKAVADSGLGTGVLDGAQNLELSGNINAFYYNYDLTMTADQVAQYKALSDAAASAKAFSPEYYEAAGKLHGFLATTQEMNKDLTALAKTIADIPRDALTGDQLDQVIAVLDNADEAIETIQGFGGAAAAAAQGALQTVDDDAKNMQKAKPISPEQKAELEGEAPGEEEENPNIVKGNESKIYKGQKLSEGQIYLLFNRLSSVNQHMLENKLMFESVFEAVSHYNRTTLDEGPLDFIKKAGQAVGGALKKGAQAVGKGVSKVGGAIKGAGKQLTTKVTAEKLNRAWKDAGSPTDSDEVYDVIKSLGVNDDVIKGTYDSMQIKPPATTDAPDADADADAADNSTNANAPTDSTAGDAGSDTTATGAADANAGGDEPAAGGNTKSLDYGSYDEDHGVPLTPQAAQEFKKLDKATQDERVKSATDAGYTQNQDGSFSKPGDAEKGATDADTASASTTSTDSDTTASTDTKSNNTSSNTQGTGTTSSNKDSTADKTSTQGTEKTSSNQQSTTSTSNTTGGGSGGSTTSTDTTSSSSSSQTGTSTNKQGSGTSSTNTGSSDSSSNDMQKAANTKGAPDDFKQAAQAAAGGTATGVDLKVLAGQIKKAGPEVVDSVKKVLATA